MIRKRTGIVADDSPLTVYVAGSTTASPCVSLDGYAPVVGDHVVLLEDGPDLFIIGSLAAGRRVLRAHRLTSAQNIATVTIVTLDLTISGAGSLDPLAMWDDTNNRAYAPFAGMFAVAAGLRYSANTTGLRVLRIVHRNVGLAADYTVATAASGPASDGSWEATIAGDVYLNFGDYVYAIAYQTSGATLTADLGLPGIPFLSMHHVN